MNDDPCERELARALGDILDRKVEPESVPELAAEIETLNEIDRVIEADSTLPGRLSGHRILGEIGSGGMGRVLLALDEALGRKVAIKTLAARYAEDAGLRARFMQEARAMARVSHPHVARIYNLGPAGETPHFVMEYLEGAQLTRAAAGLSFGQKAELMLKVASAVHFLHQQGIVHRDLKPANILVGPDLEPKILDFGLALDLGGGERLSRIGEIAGTPEYLSPEQASGAAAIDARSDVFALGSLFYELLTGEVPFRGETVAQLLAHIREQDPAPPRRLHAAIPRDLQNICFKALEKDPAARYGSAREMADDLRRFLAGEAVHAEPPVYARLIRGKVAEHLRDLEAWRRDEIVSEAEYEGMRKHYNRLLEPEDAWILAARRLTLPQVTLYLGAWLLAVGAAFLTSFRYPALAGAPSVVLVWGFTLPMVWVGIREWRGGRFRVAIAYLLAFCLLAPIASLVTVEELRLFAVLTRGDLKFEFSHRMGFAREATNAQFWWALFAGLPICTWMRRFTQAPVFSLFFAANAALLSLATLLRMGLIDWVDRDPGRAYLHLLPIALVFLAAGYAVERLGHPEDSCYFYPFAVGFTWAALTGAVSYYEPYANWLRTTFPWTRGQLEYLFIGNAAIYFALDRVFERASSTQLHAVGKTFRFVIPGHVLTSLLLLGMHAKGRTEERVFEWLLPAMALAFVFSAIPRQMKNFFVTGLVFFAAGAYRLQENVFPGRAGWPAALLTAGLTLMIAAAWYAPLRVALLGPKKFLRKLQS
ncbi:MAG: serine/threonine protein kinase [Acidobacteria bacterium]|nr:serine/threonine protein kinase [Acidobacteriota bacterium]